MKLYKGVLNSYDASFSPFSSSSVFIISRVLVSGALPFPRCLAIGRDPGLVFRPWATQSSMAVVHAFANLYVLFLCLPVSLAPPVSYRKPYGLCITNNTYKQTSNTNIHECMQACYRQKDGQKKQTDKQMFPSVRIWYSVSRYSCSPFQDEGGYLWKYLLSTIHCRNW